MKKMKKKVWACLMALAIALTMLPGMAVKAEAATGYGIWVGDTEVTSECTSGNGWSYDAETGTLTLDNFYYKGDGKTPDSSNRGGICVLRPNSANQSPATLYIKLQGNNYIENTSKRSYWNAGIFSYSDLVISGEGSLTVKGGTGGTSHGISGQNLIIESGTIEAEGRASAGSSGIYMDGDVTVNGGKVTASADNSTSSVSRGIECDGSFIMNGGEVTATAKNAKSTGYGIEADYNIICKGGILKAGGETQALYSHTNSYPEGYAKGKEYPGKKTLTVADFTFYAPSDLIYDKRGKESKVVFNGDNDCGDITVKYYDADNKLVDGLPTEVGGPYTVKIDVAENDEYDGATDLTDSAWKFVIKYGEATSDMYTVSGINAAGWAKDKVIITGTGDNEVAKESTYHFADSTDFGGIETDNGNVTIFVQSVSGKVYRRYLTYKLDKTAPIIDGLEDGKVYCGTSKEFSVSDALSGLADVKDGEESLGADGTYQLAAGTHTITATDIAGNSTTVNVEVNGEHEYKNVEYIWNAGNTECKAHVVCKNCGQEVDETATVTSEVTQKQTCELPEKTLYTATFNNTAFAVQQKKVQTKEAAGHTAGDWIVDKEATVTEAGSRHRECTVCRTVLETEAIAKLPTPAPVTYKIIEGADGTYALNADGTYTIRANGEFSKFVSVEMDGKVVDSKNYTAKSGSTIITFSKEYMSSLSAGKHTVKVNFTDGYAETTLTVAQKDTKDTGKTDAGKKPASKSPKTGDNSNLIAWFILLVASVCILGSLRAIRRQRRR